LPGGSRGLGDVYKRQTPHGKRPTLMPKNVARCGRLLA
jgi:hypothetical protein